MKTRIGLSHKLWKAFVIQAALISLAAIGSVFAARYILGDVLIMTALENEAKYFWQRYEQDKNFPRPDTYNLNAYLQDIDVIPDAYIGLGLGAHTIEMQDSDLFIVYVTEHQGETLWLEFDGKQVSELAMFFGLLPLAVVLIVIYLSSWIAYRVSHRAISPVLQLAKQLEHLDPKELVSDLNAKNFLSDDMDQEVAILAKALDELVERIEQFVERERNFTRDASHELRSPITVIKIATDMLLEDSNIEGKHERTIQRIKRSASDMEKLIEALLLLARESEEQLSYEPVLINDLITEEIERLQMLHKQKPIQIIYQYKNQLMIEASDKVLSVLIGNVLRNAFSYTDEGEIIIAIEENSITIKDSGKGMDEKEIDNVFKPFFRGSGQQRGGYGVGLTIVKMLSERFNWTVNIDSQPNIGTTVSIRFPPYIVLHN